MGISRETSLYYYWKVTTCLAGCFARIFPNPLHYIWTFLSHFVRVLCKFFYTPSLLLEIFKLFVGVFLKKFIKISHRVVFRFFQSSSIYVRKFSLRPCFLTIILSYNCYYEKTGSEVKNITDEIAFDLPDGWEWVRIKNFCLVIFSGKSPKYSKNETSHKVIGQQANQWSGVNMQYVKYCTNDFAREMPESYYLQNGDVLLNTLGNGTLGRSGIFYNNSSNERVLTDGHLFVFRTQNKVLSKYLLLFLRTKYDEILKSANGTTNQTFLSLGKTSQWLIPVPPENEIIKIISELDKYEPLLIEYDIFESHKAKLDGEIYDKLKKSILQYAIQGKLVPQDSNDEPAFVLLERIRAEKKAQLGKKYVESYIYKGDDNCYYEKVGKNEPVLLENLPFDIPDSWRFCRLGELIELQSGRDLEPNYYNDQRKGVPYITGASNIQNGHVTINRWTATPISISHKGDLLITCKGTIGTMAYNDIGDIHIARQIMSIKTKDIFLKYVKIFLETYVSVLKTYAKSFIPGINRDDILNAIIPIPPYNEQIRICNQTKIMLNKLKDEN